MERHFQLSDDEFEQQFINCKIDPAEFTHEAHLRLAYINIGKYGVAKAEENIQNQLKNFVEFVGAKDKYHVTITVASIKMVCHFMLKAKSENFKDFIVEFPRLKHGFKELISSHYGFDVFNSESARTVFVAPDLRPFD